MTGTKAHYLTPIEWAKLLLPAKAFLRRSFQVKNPVLLAVALIVFTHRARGGLESPCEVQCSDQVVKDLKETSNFDVYTKAWHGIAYTSIVISLCKVIDNWPAYYAFQIVMRWAS